MYVGMLFLREIVGKKVKKEKTPWENYLQKNDLLGHIFSLWSYTRQVVVLGFKARCVGLWGS